MKLLSRILVLMTAALLAVAALAEQTDANRQRTKADRFDGHEQLVAETHAASLKLREASLRRTIARDTCWPHGLWGDNLWCLAALYLNEKTDDANARLLERANEYIASNPSGASVTLPEAPGDVPWTFFSSTDYVRILCLFHSKSLHFPGRLKPETEAAMKEALWLWVSGESKIAEAGPDDLLLLLGTENHDLNRRPAYYLVASLLQDDPGYRDRKLGDGHTTAEHAAAYTAYFRQWPRVRAKTGLWVEIGSNGYQKYSWPALFNLHDLAPDPVIRHRFGLLLDLAFVEEAQISVHGLRGGGRSRSYFGGHGFAGYANLLYAIEGRPAGSSHSRVIETSRYQLPPEAILLARRAFPADEPFLIRNRVLGEIVAPRDGSHERHELAADSALVNYAWRTPTYLLGSTLENPALSALHPETGDPGLKYTGISIQNRHCGLLFQEPTNGKVAGIHPIIERTRGGRPQHSFWTVQHEHVLMLQRIPPGPLGSYSTGRISIRFDGDNLTRTEEDGWIFVTDGRAFAGVRFLDGGHVWDESKVEASPAEFDNQTSTSRILIHAGDTTSHGSYEGFRQTLRAQSLQITADLVDYRFEKGSRIEMQIYRPAAHESFELPRVNGETIDLRPLATWQSPYLNSPFGSDRVTVSVGPISRILDFSSEGQ